MKSRIRATSTNSAFTIIEVLVVLIIIAILIAIGTVSYHSIQARAKDTTAKEDLAKFGSMMVKYKAENGAYPSSTSSITDAYAVKFDTDVLADTPYYNLLYCTVSPYASYALLARTKSGARFYVKNNESPVEYTDSTLWTSSTISTICTSVLSGSTSTAASAGFSSSAAPTGWRSWVRGE